MDVPKVQSSILPTRAQAPFSDLCGPRMALSEMLLSGVPKGYSEETSNISFTARSASGEVWSDLRGRKGWEQRIAEFVLGGKRIGKRIQLREVTKGEVNEPALSPVDLERDRQALRAKFGSRQDTSAQDAVYSMCEALSLRLGGHKPNVFQVVSALALRPDLGGLEGEGYLLAVDHMRSRNRGIRGDFSHEPPWIGTAINYRKTLDYKITAQADGRVYRNYGGQRFNLPAMVVRFFMEHPGEKYSSYDVMQEMFGGNIGLAGYRCLIGAFQIPAILRLVRKHPLETKPPCTRPQSVYSSNLTHWKKSECRNPYYQILEQAANGPFPLKHLYYSSKSDDPNVDGRFSTSAMNKAAHELETIGLVTIGLKRWQENGSEGVAVYGRPDTVITITDIGRKLITPYIDACEGAYIKAPEVEYLHRLLLGEELPT